MIISIFVIQIINSIQFQKAICCCFGLSDLWMGIDGVGKWKHIWFIWFVLIIKLKISITNVVFQGHCVVGIQRVIIEVDQETSN